jgi:hypothetical protein
MCWRTFFLKKLLVLKATLDKDEWKDIVGGFPNVQMYTQDDHQISP